MSGNSGDEDLWVEGYEDNAALFNRLAGIDEAGATEVLRFIPTEEAVMEKVVSLFGHEGKE